MKLSVLVVLYNREIYCSGTIKSLLTSTIKFEQTQLIIWNNGPKALVSEDVFALEDKGLTVHLEQSLENMALSQIYNRFIDKYGAERYVILDHDSQLNDDYLKDIYQDTPSGVLVPVIKAQGILHSPEISNGFHQGPFTQSDDIRAIGSGLCVDDQIAKCLKQKFASIFDERFYLYGVDTTFFYRLKQAGLNDSIHLISGFQHSLSKLEQESEAATKFRRIERGCELGLTFRFYPKKHKLKSLLRITFARCFKLGLFSVTHLYKALLKGKHYRAR